MTKTEIKNLQSLFKDKFNFENIKLGLTIISASEFYYPQIRGYALTLIDRWNDWIVPVNSKISIFSSEYNSYIRLIYNFLGYEQNKTT